MARILIASELGSNLGHLGQMLPLAAALQAQGDEVVFVLRDVAGVDGLLRPRAIRYLQAPLLRARAPQTEEPQPCSYSEILQRYGYLDREGLFEVVSAWRELYAVTAADAIVCEYAPTALLATRCVRTPRFLYGDGFSLPPRVSPFPDFRSWEQNAESRLEASDAVVLGTVNEVLGRSGVQPLPTLQALLEADEEFLCTFNELDPYGTRDSARYRGSVFTSHEGAEPLWPAEGDKRVYVYLRPGMPAFDTVAQQLRDSAYSVLWVAPGLGTRPAAVSKARVSGSRASR